MRGTILKDTTVGNGIIFVEGNQKSFSLEKHWKSGEPPRTGDVVDVKLTPEGDIETVQLVDESVLRKEKAKQTTDMVAMHGKNAVNTAIEKVGIPGLVSIFALLITWLFFNFISVKMFGQSGGISLYEMMKLGNSGNPKGSAGFYGFLLWISALAPLIAHFVKDKRAWLAYCMPLVFLVITLMVSYSKASSAMSAIDSMGSYIGNNYASQAKSMIWKSFSFGFGFYLSWLITGYMTYYGVKKFLKK